MSESIRLLKASRQHSPIIENLMQFYMYDFSRFVDLDVEADGLFAAYKGLSDYWTDKNRFPYLIQKGNTYAGFALVKWIGPALNGHYSMAEFFVMQKYRRAGVGKTIAMQLFDLHAGNWEVFQRETNTPAQLFWRTVINAYTKGDFTQRLEDGKNIQNFKSH
jgi:predicted acetyltransferase